ncbi:MAG: histidine kinase [Saprospiraceae bacterium]|nr:histidine kinase [Saprospiraceae bacterium]
MKKSVIAMLHVGYWFLYACLLILILMCLTIGTDLSNEPIFRGYRFWLVFSGFALVPAVAGFYMYYGFLFNRFLTPKKIPALFLAGFVSALLCGLLGAMNLSLLSIFDIGNSILMDGWKSATLITFFISMIAMLNGGMGLLLRGFIRWYDELKLKEDLTRKNFETELALVKLQLDPHFLFNTINNIDVLITKDAEKASACLKKLSDIMRFMLYESHSAQISLQEEWAYVEKLIDLQKIRTSIANYANYTTDGDLAAAHIAPMTLIPFVENAFKHANRVKAENAIRLHLKAVDGTIVFECENKFNPNAPATNEPGGLGNDLIAKRLSLLYPDRHRLTMEKNGDLYGVRLTIGQKAFKN